MDIQNLVRERVIGNIKIGTKGKNGLPQKLSHFNVEEDKGTNSDMVDIFKKVYPGEPTKLKIRFTTENPFNFKFKRYVNGKAVCIGNGTKAITVGKDAKNNNTQIEVECGESCPHLQSGKCKLKGSLKFVLDGIEAGGVWNLSTSGGISLSNIASEIVKYKKQGISIVGVPFELSLTEQQSLAYGTYYSIDLHRSDIKPQIIENIESKLIDVENEIKEITDGKEEIKQIEEQNINKKVKSVKKQNEIREQEPNETEEKSADKEEDIKEEDFSNYLVVKKYIPTIIKGNKFIKIIFQDINQQDVEYVLHPKANQDLIEKGIGTVIEVLNSKLEENMNILCKYEIKQEVPKEENEIQSDIEKLKEAV
ncbi:MAG: hypothetical protein J6M60_00385 [Clostridia bacterium]|nr:hypothetical protein [Clostridia bacterium]